MLAELDPTGNIQPTLFDFDPTLGLPSNPDAHSIYEDEQIVDAAFHHFRATGFPYRKLPVHVCMQEINRLATSPAETWIDTNAAYQVADTYHPHRYHSAAEGMISPHDAFISDKLFLRALRLEMQHSRAIPDGYPTRLSIVSGVQSCSNFRPGFAMYIYKRFCKETDTVLDTSTGYGGRLVGFIASGIRGGVYRC